MPTEHFNPHTGESFVRYQPHELDAIRLANETTRQVKNGQTFHKSPLCNTSTACSNGTHKGANGKRTL